MEPRWACGLTGHATFVSGGEVAWACGNTIVVLDLQTQQQRLLLPPGQGIRCFAASSEAGVIAIAEQAPSGSPRLWVLRVADGTVLATLESRAEIECTAVALSTDGELLAAASGQPSAALSVWNWKKGELLATAPLEEWPVTQLSFHPVDPGQLLTTAAAAISSSGSSGSRSTAGAVHAWALERNWAGFHLAGRRLRLPAGWQPRCHAWAPEGVYIGCRSGEVLFADYAATTATATHPGNLAVEAPDATAAGSSGVGVEGSCEVEEGSSGGDNSSGVSCIAVNADAVVVCGGRQPVRWLSRAASPGAPLQQLGEVPGTAAAESIQLGGPDMQTAIATTRDGCLLLVSLLPPAPGTSGLPEPQVEPLADCHAGRVVGLAAITCAAGGADWGSNGDTSTVLSAGVDGTLRAWDVAAGAQLVGRRDVAGGAVLTALVSCPERGLAAAGSASGVLRVVATSDRRSLPLVWRGRLAKGPVTAAAFAPGGSLLACAAVGGEAGASSSSGSRVALLLPGPCKADGAPLDVQLLGYADCSSPVLSLAWVPPAPQSEAPTATVLVASLASGRLVLLTLSPLTAAATPEDNNGSADGGAEGQLMRLAPEQLQEMQFQLEAPLRHIVAVRGPPDALGGGAPPAIWVIGHSAVDRTLQRVAIPVYKPPIAAGAGDKQTAPALRASASATPHDKLGAGLAASPCGLYVASLAADGTAAVLDTVSLAPAPGTASGVSAASRAHTSGGAGRQDASAAVCFDATGKWVVTGGPDGSMFVHGLDSPLITSSTVEAGRGLPQLLAASASTPQEIADAPDDPSEPLLPQLLAKAACTRADAAGAPARAAAMAHVDALRARLLVLLERNAAAPEAERLGPEEVLVDVDRLQELRTAADAEAAALKARLLEGVARDEILAARIKSEFWDSLEVKPAAITGAASGQEVWNFLLPRDPEGAARYERAAALRAAELLDGSNLGAPTPGQLLRSGGNGEAAVLATTGVGAATGAKAAAVTAPAGGPAGGSAADAASAGAAGPPASGAATQQQQQQQTKGDFLEALAAERTVAAEQLLYDDLDVTTPARKLLQAEILWQVARGLKASFNAEFAALASRKHGDADRVTDLNTRLDELDREISKLALAACVAAGAAGGTAASSSDVAAGKAGGTEQSTAGVLGGGGKGGGSEMSQSGGLGGGGQAGTGGAKRAVFAWAALEDLEESLFSIKPGEVQAAKYQSAEDRARAAAQAAAEAEARRRAAADDAFDRALKDMMGGTLARPTDGVDDLAAARPAWMDGNPQDMTEEQLREYKEYQAREKAAIEERVKRRAAMEQERRALSAAAEETVAKFDEALAVLARHRLDVLSELCSLEGRAARLVADAQAATEANDEAEAAARGRAAAAAEAHHAAEKELREARALLAVQQERVSALHAEEKGMDRALKREFHSVDPTDTARLVQLYKQRLVAAAASAAAVPAAPPPGSAQLQWLCAVAPASGAGTTAALLGPPQMEFVPLGDLTRPEGLDAAEWDRFLGFREERARLEIAAHEEADRAAAAQRQAARLAERAAITAAAAAAAEAEASRIRAARQAACLDVEVRFRLRAGQVEAKPEGASAELPGAVMVPREAVDELNEVVRAKGRQKMELLTQIKDFKRGIYALEWENKRTDMEAEDVASLARELQLLHVTRDFQMLVKAGPGADASAAGREVAALEALLKTREDLHRKHVEEGRRRVLKLEREIVVRQQQNEEVERHLQGLGTVLEEQGKLQDAATAAREEPHERRMRSMMVARKLRDIEAAQSAEIAALRTELRRLERRTFPHFPEPAATLLGGAGRRRRPLGADERAGG